MVVRKAISIHALREEGDQSDHASVEASLISIHALREEGDALGVRSRVDGVDFYPRPPRGGRRKPVMVLAVKGEFLSTPSARRATVHHLRGHDRVFISIHALREEGDVTRAIKEQWPIYFYPRPPRGGRPVRCF